MSEVSFSVSVPKAPGSWSCCGRPGSDGKPVGSSVSSLWQPLEQLPIRWPRLLIDLIASVQCQVLDMLDSVPRDLEHGVRAA